jgi:hypothetical protein
VDLSVLLALSRRHDELEGHIAGLAATLTEISAALWPDATQTALLDGYCSTLERLVEALAERLALFATVQRDLYWRGGAATEELDAYWSQLTGAALRETAPVTLAGPDPVAALRELLRRTGRLGQRVAGKVFVEAPGGRLQLSGELEGIDRLVLATQADVHIEGLRVRGGFLSIVTTGDLHVAGRVDAFLLACGTTRVQDGTHITGALVTGQLRSDGEGRATLTAPMGAGYASWQPGSEDALPGTLRLWIDPEGDALRLDLDR